MKTRIHNFESYLKMNEASVESIANDFPTEWKRLEELGFYDATTPIVAKNGNIILKNRRFDYYPAGIVLQVSSGYVRDRAVTSGFLKRDLDLKGMLDYLITRFGKMESSTDSGVSPEVVTMLNQISKSKAIKNPETGRFDFSGSVELYRGTLDSLKTLGIKLGTLGNNFSYNGRRVGDSLALEDLEYFPTEVKGKFDLTHCDLVGFSDFLSFPTKMGNWIYLYSVQNLKSLSGLTVKSGKKTVITVINCYDLRSLGEDLPDEVFEFSLSSSGKTIPLSSLKGCPKIVHKDFSFHGTNTMNLEGGPESVGGRYEIKGNKFLTSLRGFPLEFNHLLNSDIIESWFNLQERIKIVSDGIYFPVTSYYSHRDGKTAEATQLQRDFVVTSLPPDALQSLIDQNPSKMIFALKSIWNDLKKIPEYKDVKFPDDHAEDADLVSDLTDIGL
jgi:hypothetical protein